MNTDQPISAPAPTSVSDHVSQIAAGWGIDMAQVLAKPRPDPEEASRRFIAQERARDRLARFEADVGPEYRESDWSHPNLATFLSVSRRVMAWEVGKRGMLISGPTGRGKTRAVSALYRRLAVDEGHEVRYFSAADWFGLLSEEVRYGRDEARKFINRHASTPIFILDDMGQQAKVSVGKEDWSQAWFFRFLDIRRAQGLPLILTTNLSAEAIAADAEGKKSLRSDPLIVRLLDLCEVVSYESTAEQALRKAKK